MNKATVSLIAAVLLATLSMGWAEKVEVELDGATTGKWTMDLDAAKKLAAEKKLPILLDFSGSDWCGWCKVMEENVFTQPAWTAYATNNLVMVLLDYPKDKSLVPGKYVKRNQALQAQYGVQGYPTFVVLDDDGETELGRLGAGQEKTPASFQSELNVLLRNRPAAVATYAAALSPKDRAEFTSLHARLAEQQAALKTVLKEIETATKRSEELAVSMGPLNLSLMDFRVGQLSEAEQEKYRDLKTAADGKEKELRAWLATQPEQSEENMVKFKAMQSELADLALRISVY